MSKVAMNSGKNVTDFEPYYWRRLDKRGRVEKCYRPVQPGCAMCLHNRGCEAKSAVVLHD